MAAWSCGPTLCKFKREQHKHIIQERKLENISNVDATIIKLNMRLSTQASQMGK